MTTSSATTQQTHSVVTTPANKQRRYNVSATSRRCSDVVTTLLLRCVCAGNVQNQTEMNLLQNLRSGIVKLNYMLAISLKLQSIYSRIASRLTYSSNLYAHSSKYTTACQDVQTPICSRRQWNIVQLVVLFSTGCQYLRCLLITLSVIFH